MRTIDNSTDLMETTQNVHRAMKMLEMIDNKLDDLEAIQAEHSDRLTYELMKELPNLKVLAETSRNLLADEYQSLDATFTRWLDDESEQLAE